MIFKARHNERAGKPISRITDQLNSLDAVIEIEMEVGARTPDGFWDWLGRKRIELKNLGRVLTNREMFGYFREANVVKTHKLRQVVQNHCLAIEFTTRLGKNDDEGFRDKFGKVLRTMGEYLNTEARGGNSGKRAFMITPN